MIYKVKNTYGILIYSYLGKYWHTLFIHLNYANIGIIWYLNKKQRNATWKYWTLAPVGFKGLYLIDPGRDRSWSISLVGHSLLWEETQFKPWAEGHPYSTTDNLLKTSCSLLFGHGIGPKLQNLGPALSWVSHTVFLPGKNNWCSLFCNSRANMTQ